MNEKCSEKIGSVGVRTGHMCNKYAIMDSIFLREM